MEQEPLNSRAALSRFLLKNGFKCSRQWVSKLVVQGAFVPDGDGVFDPEAALTYARANLASLPGQAKEAEGAAKLKMQKMKVDLQFKKAQAGRQELRHKVEMGLFIEREKYELALVARMAMFKGEIEVLGAQMAEAMAARFGMDPDRIPDFREYWGEATQTWLDVFSEEKDQVIQIDFNIMTPGLLTGGRVATGKMTGEAIKEAPRKRYNRSHRKGRA